ncbi:MAG: hypothetical protein RL450_263 [Actinomycetota bacterium]|jgi:hypothetical protein
MTLTVVVASILVFSWKLLGYLIPQRFITESVQRFSERVTVTLLAALVGIQTLSGSEGLVLDARVPAVLVAAGLLLLRLPFIVVIVAAALVAAGLRALGF